MAFSKANFAETTLGAAIANNSDTAITVISGTPFPTVPFLVTIGTEILKCTNKGAGTNWTVTRGEQSSTATAHDNGTAVQNNITAGDFTNLVEGPASVTGDHLAVFDSTTGKLIKDGGAVPTLSSLGTAAYSEGTWTPVLNGFTIVGAAPAVTGTYKKIGKLEFVTITIAAGSGGNTSVASTAASNNISGILDWANSQSVCSIVNSSMASLGNGMVQSSLIYLPTIAAQTAVIIISSVFPI